MTLERLSGDAAVVELWAPPVDAARWDQELWLAPGATFGAFLVDAFEPTAFYAGSEPATTLLLAQPPEV